jgi:hypothetical protein
VGQQAPETGPAPRRKGAGRQAYMPTENDSPTVRSVSGHARENSDFLPIVVDNNSVRCCGPEVKALNDGFAAGSVVGKENLFPYAWLRRPIHSRQSPWGLWSSFSGFFTLNTPKLDNR